MKPPRKPAASTPGPVTAFVGTDDGAVMAAAREFAAQNAPAEAGEFGIETIDGGADNADQAVERIHATLDALLTLPFLGGGKLVWLKNATFLADTVTGRADSVLDALEKLSDTLTSGLPPGILFLLSATEVDRRRGFYRKLSKCGTVTVIDRIDTSRAGWEEQVAGLVRSRGRELGLRFDTTAVELFVARCGANTRLIESELEKLSLQNLGDGRVTEADVSRLVPDSSAGVIWELGNAMARRDPARCMDLLDRLLRQGESGMGILLAAITPTVRNLLAARHVMERHGVAAPTQPWEFGRALERLPAEAQQDLPRKKDGTINAYALGLAAAQARRFRTHELAAALDACLEANLALVSSQTDPRVVLSRLLLRVTGVARPSDKPQPARA
jgi:DNA polymerase-3 subunit delta